MPNDSDCQGRTRCAAVRERRIRWWCGSSAAPRSRSRAPRAALGMDAARGRGSVAVAALSTHNAPLLAPAVEDRAARCPCDRRRPGRPRWLPGDRMEHLFEERCDATPDELAVDAPGPPLTFAELDARANRLARHLLAQRHRRG